MKKLLSLFVVLSLLSTFFIMPTSAATQGEITEIVFSFNSGNVKIVQSNKKGNTISYKLTDTSSMDMVTITRKGSKCYVSTNADDAIFTIPASNYKKITIESNAVEKLQASVPNANLNLDLNSTNLYLALPKKFNKNVELESNGSTASISMSKETAKNYAVNVKDTNASYINGKTAPDGYAVKNGKGSVLFTVDMNGTKLNFKTYKD